MMTWKQREAEERFFEVREWYWDAKRNEYGLRVVATELTILEAEELFDGTEVTLDIPQIDIFEEHQHSFEKIAMKVLENDGVFITWDKDEM